jgi:hypothetical protein
MITELVYYKGGKLITPFYNKITHTVISTLRSASFQCCDINQDGIVEIPIPDLFPLPSENQNGNTIQLVHWSVFDGVNGLTPKLSAVMNYTEDYYFIYPDKWNHNVTINNSAGDNSWTFCEWDSKKGSYGKVLFSINVYNESDWNSLSSPNSLVKLSDKNGTVYAAEIPVQPDTDSFNLSITDIKKDFNLLN